MFGCRSVVRVPTVLWKYWLFVKAAVSLRRRRSADRAQRGQRRRRSQTVPNAWRCGTLHTPASRPASVYENTCSGVAAGSSSLLQAAKRAGEEDERVVVERDAQMVDLPDDDPVIAGCMLGDDL